MKIKLSALPARKNEYKVSFPRLDGGINLWELDYRMNNNQSPDMRNLVWQNGGLCSRDGQCWAYNASLGCGWAAYEGLFHDRAFLHIGSRIYCCDPADETVVMTELADLSALYQGYEPSRGVFFLYNGRLYYKARGVYVVISRTDGNFTCVKVSPYTPVIIINAEPSSGAGDIYQPENRYSGAKTVRYTADGTSFYKLPVSEIESVDCVIVNGTTMNEGIDYSVSLNEGSVTFAAAPAYVNDNGVSITYTKGNAEYLSSIMTCHYAIVYGGGTDLCIVLAGAEMSPNAYFWNGNTAAAMDPGYFPAPHYNLAGDRAEAITGFGKQQDYLVIFKESSIGRASAGTAMIEGREVIEMPYVTINAAVGCDLPYSIQLIQNNLVFCSSRRGVHLILDSSSAYENNIILISRNVNGIDGAEEESRGLICDLKFRGTAEAVSLDDDRRYWLAVNGNVYMWDYTLSDMSNPSWFFCTGINANAFIHGGGRLWHMDAGGRLTVFKRSFSDYGAPIHKVYRFATQSFGAYERLKDVLYAIFVVRGDTDSDIDVYYRNDYVLDTRVSSIHSGRTWRLAPRDLTFRDLGVYGFATVAKRVFGSLRVRHFSMLLENNTAGADMCVISAELHYRFSSSER
jgi:hypothetical protein